MHTPLTTKTKLTQTSSSLTNPQGRIALALLLLATLCACSGDPLNPYTDCSVVAGMISYCGFQNPEDIEPLPDGRHLLVSEFGGTGANKPGALSLFDMEAKERRPLALEMGEADWGDPSCSPPGLDALSPHGIYLGKYGTAGLRLLAVNHARQQDRVEMFEVLQDSGHRWRLVWRGALCPPGNVLLNDVASFEDGHVYMTHMFDKIGEGDWLANVWLIIRVVAEANTGQVLAWHSGSDYQSVDNSEGSMPNGINVSESQRSVFVGYYGAHHLVRLALDSGEIAGSFELPAPDNIVFDGEHLWVASHDFGPASVSACDDRNGGPCLLPFSIYQIDPVQMTGRQVLSQARNSPPYGAASVAVPVGDRLWLGTFLGDRIISAPLSP